MPAVPIIYLSNWSSYRTPGMHGPGRKWSIMANPRHWEKGDGIIHACTPLLEDLLTLQSGAMGLNEYRLRCETRWDIWPGAFLPGNLRTHTARTPIRKPSPIVVSGDTLCCGCGRTKPCHRVWLAPRLHHAGWSVILDGEPYLPELPNADP